MQINSFAKSVIGAAVFAAAATSAVAATTNQVQTVAVNPSALVTFTHVAESGSFFDTLNFTIPAAGTLGASAVSITLAPTSNVFDIDGLTGTLWNNFHPNGTSALGTITGNNTTFNFSLLSAGEYHIDFTGNITGTSGGAYLAALNLAPVPEPETYAMLLAGLGVMGAIARRRKAA